MKLAERMSQLGTETAFEVLARAEALRAQGRDVINLGIGQPDFSTAPHIVEAAAKALRDGHHGYTPANGIALLREAVVADVARYRSVEVNPDNVMIMPGGKPTMFFAIMMFGEPGAEIMYPNPGFPIYESVIRFSGATPVPIELQESSGFSFSADDVLGRITDKTRLIIVNTPANPTGGIVAPEELDRFAAGLERFPRVAVLSDEIYSRMLYDGYAHRSLLAYPHLRERLIVLDGWSKTYAMTGWRLGWSLWPDSLIGHATKLAVNDHSCVSAAVQWAGIAALEGPQDAVDEMVRAFDERRKLIVAALNALPGVSCVTPLGAFYAFPNITKTGKTSSEMQDLMLTDAGVATVAGTSFGRLGEGYVRFSYAASKAQIEEAMARIAKIL